MRIVYGRLPYELSIVELEPAEVLEFDDYAIAAVPVRHSREHCLGYVLAEDPRPGEFDVEAARALGVTPGPDFGALQRGETVGAVRPEQVTGPAREGRKIVLSGDTAPCEALAVAAHQADVLIHEATFAEEEAERARETSHSTARQAAEVARRRRGPPAGPDPRLQPLRRRGAARRGPGGVRRDRVAAGLRHDRGPVSRAGPGASSCAGPSARRASARPRDSRLRRPATGPPDARSEAVAST